MQGRADRPAAAPLWAPLILATAALVVSAWLSPPVWASLGAAGAALAWALLIGRGGGAGSSPSAAPAAAPEPAAPPDPLPLAVLADLPEPILVVRGGDPEDVGARTIVRANKAARAALRLPSLDADGHPLVTALRDPNLLEAVDEALFGGRAQSVDYQPGGVQGRHMSAWIAPLKLEADPDERDRLAIIRLRDETDARRAELMRVDFLANASHELRTPLASLSGFIETLRGHAREDPAAREKFLAIMAVQAERMTRLVADLLSLSRIELNEHIPPSGRVDLAAAVCDVVDATQPLAARRGVRLTTRRGEGAFDVVGDRDQLIQVIQNLTDNAIKYSPDNAEVEIILTSDLSADDAARGQIEGAAGLSLLTPDRDSAVRYARISVRDAGPGLARESMPRLTERFFRVEGQKSGERLGTGLGLAIVKHILNRHQGGMGVESRLGEGAMFSVYLPLSRRARAE